MSSSRVVLVTLVAGLLLLACGCSSMGKYPSFGDWFVGRADPHEPSIGFTEGDFQGTYILNDILRTPAFVVHDVGKVLMIPVALGYYAFAGSGSADPEPWDEETLPAEVQPLPVTESAAPAAPEKNSGDGSSPG